MKIVNLISDRKVAIADLKTVSMYVDDLLMKGKVIGENDYRR
jgi:hypothetical protein